MSSKSPLLGTTWEKHRYLYKENGRYIYPEDLESQNKYKSKPQQLSVQRHNLTIPKQSSNRYSTSPTIQRAPTNVQRNTSPSQVQRDNRLNENKQLSAWDQVPRENKQPSVWDRIGNFANNVGNAVSGAYDTARNAVSDAYNNARSSVSEFANNAKNAVNSTINKVSNSVNKAYSDISKWAQDASKNLGEYAGKAWQSASSAINRGMQTVTSAFNDAGDSISSAWNYITGNEARSKVRDAEQALANYGQSPSVASDLQRDVDRAEQNYRDTTLPGQISKNVQEAGRQANEFFQQMINDVSKFIGDNTGSRVANAERNYEELSEELTRAEGRWQQFYNAAYGGADEKMQARAEKAYKQFSKASKDLAEASDQLEQAHIDRRNSPAYKIVQAVDPVVKQAQQTYAEVSSNVMQLTQAAKDMFGEVPAGLNALLDSAQNAAADAYSGSVQAFNNAVQYVISTANAAGTNISSGLRNTYETASNFVSNSFNNFANDHQAIRDIQNWVDDLFNTK